MRLDIHPEYSEIKATCSCGNVILIKSTLKEDISLDVCSSCHPFYTGKQKLVDTGGRVENVNLFEGKNFLVKELTVNSKSSISLQKHYHRSEHWLITQGKPKITINKKKFFKKENETVLIPQGAIHRIENYFKKPVKIIEVQTGSILKESDIVRYKDIYGRIN